MRVEIEEKRRERERAGNDYSDESLLSALNYLTVRNTNFSRRAFTELSSFAIFIMICEIIFLSSRRSSKMNITRLARDVIRCTRYTRFLSIRSLSQLSPAVFRLRDGYRNNRNFSVFSKSPDYSEVPLMDSVTFESLSSETLESLTDYFEELVEADPKLKTADIEYSVSTHKFRESQDSV